MTELILLLREKLISFQSNLNDKLREIGKRIEGTEVVYATKYLDPQGLVEFIQMGQELKLTPLTIGENRVQDFEKKYKFLEENHPELLGEIRPVMIGNLQKNKINKALKLFSEFQAVDSMELAREINDKLCISDYNRGPAGRHLPDLPDPTVKSARVWLSVTRSLGPLFRATRILYLPIFLEVNVSGEENKHGFNIEELDQAISTIKQFNRLTVEGLMTMAPYSQNMEEVREVFRKLKELADKYKLKTSMGMSHDWEIAVEEGADVIRIGSRVFG